MPQITCNICLDVSISDGGQSLMAKRGDVGSRRLCVQFTDCGKPFAVESEASVLLNIAKGNEKKSFAGAVDSEGRAVFVLPAFALEEAGEVLCDVSAISATGDRLSTAGFTLTVEDVVCADGADLGNAGEDVLSEWLSSEIYTPLTPQASSDGFMIVPELNCKHVLELGFPQYCVDGKWKAFTLCLPQPTDERRDGWVLISCHSPIYPDAGAVKIDWGGAYFPYGVAPDIVCDCFDIICTYSHFTGHWHVGVVQYASSKDML